MIRQENKNLLTAYGITVGIVIALLIVIMNFNAWFFPDAEISLTDFTPISRGLVTEKDLKFGLFNDEKFKTLAPIMTEADIKRLEAEEGAAVTGTVRPSVQARRELRHSDPFSPF